MRCLAVIEAQRPGLDSVLIWDRDQQLVAFAYQDGKVTMSRPLEHQDTLDNAVAEVLEAFQITQAQMTRVTDWTTAPVQGQLVTQPRVRW
jgi:hypothetical protein